MTETYQKMLEVALDAAKKARQLILESRRDHSVKISLKSAGDHVTNIDLACEEAIKATILEAFPGHRFLAEETASKETDYSGPLWIIDPIDGTTNFVRGHFQIAIAIAFAVDGVVQVGVVDMPLLSETFTAIKGQGATLNGQKIHCSDQSDMRDSIIATGFHPPGKKSDQMKKRVVAVLDQTRDIRRNGAAAPDICWVACGRIDGYYEDVNPWDMAAAGLIAREAGAKMGNLSPNPKHKNASNDLNAYDLVVSAPGIFEDLCEVLKGS